MYSAAEVLKKSSALLSSTNMLSSGSPASSEPAQPDSRLAERTDAVRRDEARAVVRMRTVRATAMPRTAARLGPWNRDIAPADGPGGGWTSRPADPRKALQDPVVCP